MASKPAKPADISILIALPVTRQEFSLRVGNSDWLRKYRAPDQSTNGLETILDARWKEEYFPLVAEPLNSLAATARSLGADVQMKTSLDTLHQATLTHEIVVLFAHWKGAEVRDDDLRTERAIFIDRAASAKTSLTKWIHRHLAAKNVVRSVSDVLNESLDCHLEPGNSGETRAIENDYSRRSARRDELDQFFQDLIYPGNRLELCDGMHDRWNVESTIAPTFKGILDLTTCNSTTLTAFLAARNQHRFRTVQLPEVVEFLWTSTCLKGTLKLMAAGEFDYLEARIAAKQLLKHEIRRL